MNPFRVIMSSGTTPGFATVRTIYGKIQRAQARLDAIEPAINFVYVWGRLDILGVRQIEHDFTEMIAPKGKSVVVDLSPVEQFSSIGLDLLIKNANALNSQGKFMILLNPQPHVEKIIRKRILDDLLPIEYDLSLALERIRIGESKNLDTRIA